MNNTEFSYSLYAARQLVKLLLFCIVLPASAWAQETRVDGLVRRLEQASLSLCETIGPDGEIGPCTSEISIAPSTAFFASFKNGTITLTRHLVDSSTDDELAFVIAHEMAHIMLNHPRSTITNELAADYWAAKLLLQSGLDARAARHVFARLKTRRVFGFPFSLITHPSGSRRMREVERAVSENVMLGIR